MPELHEEYDYWPHQKFGLFIPRSYYYYDTPDGQDLIKKIWFLSTTVGKCGIAHGLISVINNHPTEVKNIGEGAVRVLEYTKPYFFVPTIFATYVHFATNWRGKDDIWNYTWGGFIAGHYMGVWYNNRLGVGFNYGLFFGLLGACYKYMQLRDYHFVGGNVPMNHQVHSLRSLKSMDFSIVDERPRTWYTAEEVKEKNIALPNGPVRLGSHLRD